MTSTEHGSPFELEAGAKKRKRYWRGAFYALTALGWFVAMFIVVGWWFDEKYPTAITTPRVDIRVPSGPAPVNSSTIPVLDQKNAPEGWGLPVGTPDLSTGTLVFDGVPGHTDADSGLFMGEDGEWHMAIDGQDMGKWSVIREWAEKLASEGY